MKPTFKPPPPFTDWARNKSYKKDNGYCGKYYSDADLDAGYFLEVYFCPCLLCRKAFKGSYFIVFASPVPDENGSYSPPITARDHFKSAKRCFKEALKRLEELKPKVG